MTIDSKTGHLSSFDWDRFSKIPSAMQSIATTLGIIVGGVWVGVTFWALGTVQRSRGEMAQVDQMLAQQPVLQIDLHWDTFGETQGSKRYVALKASFHNNGKREIAFKGTKLCIVRQVGGAGEYNTNKTCFDPLWLDESGAFSKMQTRFFDPEQVRSIALLLPPLEPGNYFLQVESKYGVSEDPLHPDEKLVRSWFLAVEQSVVNVPDIGIRSENMPTNSVRP